MSERLQLVSFRLYIFLRKLPARKFQYYLKILSRGLYIIFTVSKDMDILILLSGCVLIYSSVYLLLIKKKGVQLHYMGFIAYDVED